MTEIGIFADRLKIEILGWHKLWSFKSRFELPLSHVTKVARLREGEWIGGLRCPGTSWPGLIKAGSYYRTDGWVFWDVGNMDRAIVIELASERYCALVIETANPDATIGAIRTAIAL